MRRNLLMQVDGSLVRSLRAVSRVYDAFSQRGRQTRLVSLTIFCLALATGLVCAGQTTQSPPSKPAIAKMTNANVIQMVTAELSEQVITTSIRQAPAKDFDLTPTALIALKKAGVPDAVILVMQEVNAPVKAGSGGGDKMPTDEREPIVNAYLRQRVTSESGGALSLASFRKTNGYEERLTGAYSLEWQADISVQQDIWKAGNGFVGYFESFHVMARQPGPLDSIGMSPKHFNKGTTIRLAGDSTFRKTEQGWRLEGLKIKGAQVVAESGPADSPTPGTAPTATGSALSLETLSAAIEKGEEVVLKVKYDYAVSPYHFLHDGVVSVSKTAVAFDGTAGDVSFAVNPDKIVGLSNQPQQASRVAMSVAIKNKKGDKEVTLASYFYNTRAATLGSGPGGTGLSLECNSCDDSMSVLYELLRKVRSSSTTPSVDLGASVSGKYASRARNSSDYLELKTDGTFFLHEGTNIYNGTYTLQGTIITFDAKGKYQYHLRARLGPLNELLMSGDATALRKISFGKADPWSDQWEKKP